MEVLFTGSFSGGWTGQVIERDGQFFGVVGLEDGFLDTDGFIYPRYKTQQVLTLSSAIEAIYTFLRQSGERLAFIVTPVALRIYRVDDLLNFVLLKNLVRNTVAPVSAVMYQEDVWFTLDSVVYFYDPDADTVLPLALPTPLKPTLAVEGAGQLRGEVSYRLVYVRDTGTRRSSESPASEAASIEVNGERVRLNFQAAPSGFGITGIRIYRAAVAMDVVRPYLHVADVSPTTTTYLDDIPLANLGSALYTIGDTLPGGNALEVFNDHLMVGFNDSVYVMSAFRPETLEPGGSLAFDEGVETTGEIKRLVSVGRQVYVVKRGGIYRMVATGSDRIPFIREVVTRDYGCSSAYGVGTVEQEGIVIATPWDVIVNGQGVLGGLERVYRSLPAAVKQGISLQYIFNDLMLVLGLTNQTWVWVRGSWSLWNLQATAVGSLKYIDGTDRLILGDAGGKVHVYNGQQRGRALLRAIHKSAGGINYILRRVTISVKGRGLIGIRLASHDTRTMTLWQWANVNADVGDTVSFQVYLRGRHFTFEVILDGDVGIGGYEIWGRLGRVR